MMLKSYKKLTVILLLVGISISLSASASPEVLEFLFYSGASASYHSVNFEEQFEQRYDAEFDMTMILVETPSLDDIQYVRQMGVLDSLAHGTAEELGLIYVVSCWTKEYTHGYHTKLETAKGLADEHNSFRVRILNGKGQVMSTSTKVLGANEVIDAVRYMKIGI